MNSSGESPYPILILVGPTAVGKTELSLELAERLGGEIISADATLYYRGMDIGTAKPTLDERRRVPHHLVDVAEPDQPWTLGSFLQALEPLVGELHSRSRLPILVGGTGQYVRAIVEGWEVPEQEPESQLRGVLEEWAGEIGPESLHARLAELDPGAAAQIGPRNLRRTVRALEVIFQTGRRFSEQRRRSAPRFRTMQIGLIRPRAELYTRIDARIEEMISRGLVEEVRGLLERYPATLPAFEAIGYREVIQHLQDTISLEEAVVLMKRRTRQFVRRQANWFKPDDPQIHWVPAGSRALEQILPMIQAFFLSSVRNI